MSSPAGSSSVGRSSMEATLKTRMAALFARYPHLIGFFLQDPFGFKDVLNRSANEGDLCILDLAFSVTLNDKQHEKVREVIRATVQQLLAERPEALDLLRERTFARMMH